MIIIIKYILGLIFINLTAEKSLHNIVFVVRLMNNFGWLHYFRDTDCDIHSYGGRYQ